MAERGAAPWMGGGTRTMRCAEYLTYTLPIRYVKLAGADARGLTVKAWRHARHLHLRSSCSSAYTHQHAVLHAVLQHCRHQCSNGGVFKVSVAEDFQIEREQSSHYELRTPKSYSAAAFRRKSIARAATSSAARRLPVAPAARERTCRRHAPVGVQGRQTNLAPAVRR